MPRRFFLLFLGLMLLAGTAPAPEADPVLLPILMYHDVEEDGLGKDVVSPAELEADLRWLRASGYTAVTMGEVIDFVDGRRSLPDKPVVLSFDDGRQSVCLTVLPLLRKYGTPAVLSVIGESADEFSALPGENPRRAHASWAQLRAVADAGLGELQNHSYGLHRGSGGVFGCDRRPGESPEEYELRLAEDVLKAQECIWRETGRLPSVFTYPYGRCSALSEAVLRELGFRATLTCDFGVNRLTGDPDCLFGLKRICRSHGADLPSLLAEAAATLKGS